MASARSKLLLLRRRRALFNPNTISGLVCCPIIAKCVATGTIWSDTAATTPAVADGVVGAFDCTYTGFRRTALSDAARGTLRTSGGKWWIECAGGARGYSFTDIPSAPLSYQFAMQPTNVLATGIGISGPTNAQKLKVTDNSAGQGLYRGGKNNVNNWNFGGTAVTNNTNVVVGLNYANNTGDARNVRNGVDDGLAFANLNTAPLTVAMNRILIDDVGGDPFQGRFYGDCVHNAKLTAAELLAVYQLLAAYF